MSERDVAAVVEQIAGVEHGFSRQLAIAQELANEHPVDAAFAVAWRLYEHELVPVRMTGVLLLEQLASVHPSLELLAERVAPDPAWQVQEMLARAFDAHCRAIGYEAALPIIEGWLTTPVGNQRRAATEGLRIWTSRPFFADHPSVAIDLLASRKDDPERYVRKSAGNALRDISRKYPELVRAELATWDRSNPAIAQTYALAARFVAE